MLKCASFVVKKAVYCLSKFLLRSLQKTGPCYNRLQVYGKKTGLKPTQDAVTFSS